MHTANPPPHDPNAPSPYMFAVDIGPEHLTQFHRACAAGSATIICFGDSIVSQQADLVAPSESPWFTLVQQLRAHNPGVAITEYNYAIAACSFLQMGSPHPLSPRPYWWYDDPDRTWFSYVAAAEPDLVFLYSGGNDGNGFNTVAFTDLVRQLNALPKPPSLVFGLTYLPSANTQINDYHLTRTQNGIHFVTGWLRGFCKRNGYGFLDFMRWHNRCRDGFDSTEVTCTLVDPALGTILPHYPSPLVVADEAGRIAFPANQNDNGVPADCVTDFYINFTLTAPLEGVFRISLSDSKTNVARPSESVFCLRNAGGFFEVWWTDGLNSGIDRTRTGLAVPDSPLTLSIVLKNELLTVSYIPPSAAAVTTVPGLEYGKKTICEFNVVRFGAPFHPVLSGLGAGSTIIINNLCVADRTLCTRNVNQFRPAVGYDDIYTKLTNAGGSGAYHMNAYGVQKIMNPVIKAANFRPPPEPALKPQRQPPVISGSRSVDRDALLADLLEILETAGLIVNQTSP